MNALDQCQRDRLDRFTAALLAPVKDGAHTGIARALLATRVRWGPADLGFLRRAVNMPSATVGDYDRLMGLIAAGRGE